MVRWLKIEKGWFRQVTSWVVSAGLCFLAMAFNLGMFQGFSVTYTIGYALATGLVSNGIFDIGLVQTLLELVLKFIPKKEL
jgi:multisubunit Na+/H+ antiporter MnhB subunit